MDQLYSFCIYVVAVAGMLVGILKLRIDKRDKAEKAISETAMRAEQKRIEEIRHAEFQKLALLRAENEALREQLRGGRAPIAPLEATPPAVLPGLTDLIEKALREVSPATAAELEREQVVIRREEEERAEAERQNTIIRRMAVRALDAIDKTIMAAERGGLVVVTSRGRAGEIPATIVFSKPIKPEERRAELRAFELATGERLTVGIASSLVSWPGVAFMKEGGQPRYDASSFPFLYLETKRGRVLTLSLPENLPGQPDRLLVTNLQSPRSSTEAIAAKTVEHANGATTFDEFVAFLVTEVLKGLRVNETLGR